MVSLCRLSQSLFLTGAWLSKMDFVHSPLAWRKLHVALYELGLPARLCETTGVGVVCVCETPGTELESGCDTQCHLCVAQQPANQLPARAEACQVGTRGLLFILFILLRLVVCLLGEIKKQANKFLAWVLSGFFLLPMLSFLILQSIFSPKFYGIFMYRCIHYLRMKSEVSICLSRLLRVCLGVEIHNEIQEVSSSSH